jgi:hypothetical protein
VLPVLLGFAGSLEAEIGNIRLNPTQPNLQTIVAARILERERLEITRKARKGWPKAAWQKATISRLSPVSWVRDPNSTPTKH